MQTENPPNPFAPASLPVLVTLVLLHGGASQLAQVPGRKKRYPFIRKPGVGINGAAAHVREYTDLAAFQEEEQDMRSTRLPLFLVTRFGEACRFEAARSALARVIADPVGGPMRLRERLEALRGMIDGVLERGSSGVVKQRSVGGKADSALETENGTSPIEDDGGPVDLLKRGARERELRRIGEDDVRQIVRDQYQLEGVKLLENFGGMIEAVLKHEEELGKFDKQPAAPTPAPAPSPSPATQAANNPPAPAPVPVAPPPVLAKVVAPGTYTEASLSGMPYEDVVKIAAGLGIARGSRKALITAILAKK